MKQFYLQRKLFLLPIILFINLTGKAQSKELYNDEGYPYYSKILKRSPDQSQGLTTIVEYNDKYGHPLRRETYIETADCKLKIIVEELNASNNTTVMSRTIIELDKDKKIMSMHTYRRWLDDSESNFPVYERTPEGGLHGRGAEDNNNDIEPSKVKEWEKNWQEKFKVIEKNRFSSSDPIKSACGQKSQDNCRPKVEFFAGYSYLKGDYGIKKEGFPAGVRISGVYNLNNHVGIGIDLGFNSRKIGSENLSRNFIMIEGEYVVGDMDDCNRKLFGNVRLLAGISVEKYGPSKGSGPAFGGGAGVIHLVRKKMAVQAQVDYIAAKYKGNDKLNKNIRLSGGLKFRL